MAPHGITRHIAQGIVRVACGAVDPDWIECFDRADIDAARGPADDAAHTVDEVCLARHDSILVGVVQCRCGKRATGTVRYSPGRDLVAFTGAVARLIDCPLVPRPLAGQPASRRHSVLA